MNMEEDIIEQNSIKFVILLNENIITENNNLYILTDYYNKNKHIINIEYCFCYTCENGLLNIAKFILLLKPNINISADNEYPFCKACQNGYIDVAKWLLSIKPNINISTDNEYSFCLACYNGHLEIAKWLLEIKPTINIYIDDNYSFVHACNNGHIEVAEWLYSKFLIHGKFDFKNIDVILLINNNIEKTSLAEFLFSIIPEKYISLPEWEDIFISACSKNKLAFAKFIYKKIKNINIYIKNNEPFYLACRNGHIDIFLWLIELEPKIHEKYSINNYAFYNACSNGHYKIVESFLKYSTKTNIKINDINIGFIEVCEKGYLDIVKFFIESYDIKISVLNDAFDKAAKNNKHNSYRKKSQLYIKYKTEPIIRYLYSYNKNIKIYNETLEILAFKQDLPTIKCFYRTNYKINFSDKFTINAFLGFRNSLKLHKWLLKICPDLNLSINNDFIFRNACEHGKFKLIRWLLKIRPNINLFNEQYNYLQNLIATGCTDIINIFIQKNSLILDRKFFMCACTHNNYTIVKWILKNKNHQINQADIESGFYKSCRYDYLNIAKLMYKTFKNIIESIIYVHLGVICDFNSQDIAKWIISIYPEKYIFRYNDYHELEDFISFEDLVLPTISSSNFKKNIKECSICQENISDIVTHCNHFYCKYCIITWIFKSNNCPYCRSKLKIENLKFIN